MFQTKTWPLFYSLSYVMHTIEKKEIIPLIIPVTQLRSRERRKLHFRVSNFTNSRGGGARPRTPLRVRTSGTQCSRQRHERCMSASWTTASGTSQMLLKTLGQDMENRAAHRHQQFPGVPPGVFLIFQKGYWPFHSPRKKPCKSVDPDLISRFQLNLESFLH